MGRRTEKMGRAGTKSKAHKIDASVRCLLSPSTNLSQLLTKCTDYAVKPSEIRFLSKLFTDLASRSTGETVNKATFLQFFQLPVRGS